MPNRTFSSCRPHSLRQLTLMICWALVFFVISDATFAKSKKVPLRVVTTTAYINVHTGPGRGFPVFYALEKGETITLLKSKTDWIKITTDKDIIGWIHRRDMDNTIGALGEVVKLGLPSRDDYSKRKWELGIGFGEFEDLSSVGANAGFRFTKNLTAELRLGQATGTTENNQIFTVGLMHQPFPSWRFSPFFTLATGSITTNVRSDLPQPRDNTSSVYLFGVGGYYYFTHRVMIRLEYTEYNVLPKRDENILVKEWKIGLSTFF